MDENRKPTLSWSQPQKSDAQNVQKNPSSNATASSRSVQNEKNNMPTYAGIFVAGLVVGVLVGWGITATRSTNPTTAMNATSTSSSNATKTNGSSKTATTNASNNSAAAGVALNNTNAGTASGALTVDSPQSAGNTVAISNAGATEPTWVVVYEIVNGAPGKALGATLFLPPSQGGKASGTVTLLRPTTANTTYLVGERVDNGDRQFTPATDAVVNDSTGKRILVQLQIK